MSPFILSASAALLLATVATAVAQDRGYGVGYDAGPNYFQPSPAYDPFRDEGAKNPDGFTSLPDAADYANSPLPSRPRRVAKKRSSHRMKSAAQSHLGAAVA